MPWWLQDDWDTWIPVPADQKCCRRGRRRLPGEHFQSYDHCRRASIIFGERGSRIPHPREADSDRLLGTLSPWPIFVSGFVDPLHSEAGKIRVQFLEFLETASTADAKTSL